MNLGFLLPKEVGLYRIMEIKIELIMDLMFLSNTVSMIHVSCPCPRVF